MGSSAYYRYVEQYTDVLLRFSSEGKNATGLLSQRNFDPNTRTLRRVDASEIEDTVEKNIDGMVQTILEADKQRQEAELVGPSPNSRFQSDPVFPRIL